MVTRYSKLGLLVLAAMAAAGCKAGSCDDELVDRAVAFMKAHQSCTVDADCVVAWDYCETLPGGYCGQLSMNREGSDSSEWKVIAQELDDCAPDGCTVCEAGLIPACKDGFCSDKYRD
jgi:hypothetical protein